MTLQTICHLRILYCLLVLRTPSRSSNVLESEGGNLLPLFDMVNLEMLAFFLVSLL